MKTKTLLISLFFWIGLTHLHAQNMYVRPTTGSQSSYSIANIQNLTFSNGQLYITPTNNVNVAHNLAGIRYLNFTDLTLNAVAQPTKTTALYLYPNPVKDILHLAKANQSQVIDGVSIISLQGRLVLQQNQIDDNFPQVDVASLPQGLYLCKIKSGNNSQSIKFIKQ